MADAKTSIGWTPAWSLSRGLEKTIAWYIEDSKL